MTTRYYTGIGSRETPKDILELMEKIGERQAQDGYILRSGGASGADIAFFNGVKNYAFNNEGCLNVLELSEIYIPWNGFNGYYSQEKNSCFYNLESLPNKEEAKEIATQIHPRWNQLRQGAQKLHTRNVYQVLGYNLNHPSDFLICYAQPERNSVKGGTRTAYELARRRNVPVINLYFENAQKEWSKFVDGK